MLGSGIGLGFLGGIVRDDWRREMRCARFRLSW